MHDLTVRPQKLRLSKETLRRLDQAQAPQSQMTGSVDTGCFVCPSTGTRTTADP